MDWIPKNFHVVAHLHSGCTGPCMCLPYAEGLWSHPHQTWILYARHDRASGRYACTGKGSNGRMGRPLSGGVTLELLRILAAGGVTRWWRLRRATGR